LDDIHILTPEFQTILNEMENEKYHLVITGKAGTGKSTLLNLFRKTTARNAVVLAPTGIAALRVQGQTIHSFFKFPPRLLSEGDIKFEYPIARILKKLEILVIDEMSMIRADVMQMIDYSLRLHRRSDKAFGGVRIILFGDMFQLPPVVHGQLEMNYFFTQFESPYFFASTAWRSLKNVQYIALHQVFRQKDHRFIQLLDNIRLHHLDPEDLEELNKRLIPDFENEKGYIHLSPRNTTMNRINSRKLDELINPTITYMGEINGNFPEGALPAEQVLSLKVGAQIMTLRNDVNKQYVNGTIATITEISPVSIKAVEIHSNQVITIEKTKWEMLNYTIDPEDSSKISTKIVGKYTQFPIKLAWAMSIHKSQGQTFDKVILDMEGGAFAHGQTYVALSRCTTLDGIVLKRPLLMRDFIFDDVIFDFQNNFR